MVVKVVVLLALLLRVPAPLMALATVMLSERLKAKPALLDKATDPEPRVPVVPPLPICKVPPLMLVVPL